LGIPPELDIDWDFSSSHRDNDRASASDRDSIRTEDISDDEGRAARGHWADWDAVMDSPVFDKREYRFSMEPEGTSISPFSPFLPFEAVQENQVTIEPLLAPPFSITSLSSLSNGPSDGLGDIAEGAEEEEQEQEQEEQTEGMASASVTASTHSPSQIHGLKISTIPLPIMHYGSPPVTSPLLPPASVPRPITIPITGGGSGTSSSYVGSRPHSRSNSLSSVGPFKRVDSTNNVASMLATLKAAHPQAGSDAGDSSSIVSEMQSAGEALGDCRSSGYPLFPSNFTRLANSPTLM